MKYIIKTNLTGSVADLCIQKERLALDYKELTMPNVSLSEEEVVEYVKHLMADIKPHSSIRFGKILSFVDLDSRLGMMPSDARYDILWVPNNYVVCFLMYAYEKFEGVRNIEGIQEVIEDVVESLVPIEFSGFGDDMVLYMTEIMEIYAQGYRLVEKYLMKKCENKKFVDDYFEVKKMVIDACESDEIDVYSRGNRFSEKLHRIARMYGVEV